MSNTFKRIRDAALTGLAWAVVWAPLAVIIGTTLVDPDNSMDEMWVVIGAYPGFLCGALCFAMLGKAAGRGFRDASVARAAVTGAVAGLLVAGVPFLIGSSNPDTAAWVDFAIIGSIALLSTLSAVASVWVARTVKPREMRGVGASAV